METRLNPGTYYGDVSTAYEVNGFSLSESIYRPRTRLPAHAHENAFFYFVLQGDSTETYGGRTRYGNADTLAFHPAGEAHSNVWHDDGGRCLHLEILSPSLPRLKESSVPLDRPTETRDGLAIYLMKRLYGEFRRRDGFSSLAMEGLILEILAEFARPSVPAEAGSLPSWLREAKDSLNDRFSENPSLEEIARVAGVHPAHLARSFRQHFHCTIGDYLRHLRAECARRQLANADAPLAEIAVNAGFSDQSHMTRVFKTIYGLTPAEFRKLHRKC